MPHLLIFIRPQVEYQYIKGLPLKDVEPHGQETVASLVRRNPPKLQSSFAKASDFAKASPDRSEDTRIPPRSGDRDFLRRRVT
jgi:hypothetical protein